MELEGKHGKIEGKFSIEPILLQEGVLSKCGNAFHISIRKKDGERLGGEGEIVRFMFFDFTEGKND